MLIGDKIISLRTGANMTQTELADKLFVSRELISKWENNTRSPTYDMIKNIADLFNINSDDLITQDEILLLELQKFIPSDYSMDVDAFTKQLNQFLNEQNMRDSSVFIRRYYFADEISTIADQYEISKYHVGMILMRTRKNLLKFLRRNI